MGTEDQKRAERRAQGRRLKAAREHMNLSTAKQAAKFLRVSHDSYAQHENGTRGLNRRASLYADRLGVPEEWLMRGKNPPDWARSDIDLVEEERRGGAEHFLRPWRLFRDQTPEDLAEALGVPPDMLAAWERGDAELSEKWIRKVAAILKTTPGAILDVDPKGVPQSLLELWLEHAGRQRNISETLQSLRTGTTG